MQQVFEPGLIPQAFMSLLYFLVPLCSKTLGMGTALDCSTGGCSLGEKIICQIVLIFKFLLLYLKLLYFGRFLGR